MNRHATPDASLPPLGDDERQRYARQVMLPGWGEMGQERLKGASVLLLGCGGLGSPVALYLAAAGVGRLGLVDPDRVEVSNLQRQIAHSTDAVGEWKTASAAARVQSLNPFVAVEQRRSALEGGEDEAWASSFDVIVDATDCFASRLKHNELAFRLGVPFATGAVAGYAGQVYVFDPRSGPPCYACLVPEDPAAERRVPPQGIAGPTAGTIGCTLAMSVLQTLLATGEKPPLVGRMYYLDLATFRSGTVALCPRKGCPVCGQ